MTSHTTGASNVAVGYNALRYRYRQDLLRIIGDILAGYESLTFTESIFWYKRISIYKWSIIMAL